MQDDVPVALDIPSPIRGQEGNTDFNRESDPATAKSTDAHNKSLGEQNSWRENEPQNQHQDVHRTLHSLTFGSLSQNSYPSGDLKSSGYNNSESSNGPDNNLTPDTTQSASTRPTPNSSTPSDTRPGLQPGSNSQCTSYTTSPATSNQNALPRVDDRQMSSFFGNQPDFSNISATDLLPENTFGVPDTPGRGFDVPAGWEMSNQTTGLTPVGEGVFRHLLGLGSMDPMDIAWEGDS